MATHQTTASDTLRGGDLPARQRGSRLRYAGRIYRFVRREFGLYRYESVENAEVQWLSPDQGTRI